MANDFSHTGPVRLIWAAIFVLVALVILACGYGYYRFEADRLSWNKYGDMATIAATKTAQIEEWKRERLADVRRAANGPRVITLVSEYARNPDGADRSELKKLLEINQKEGLYANVFLFSTDAKMILAAKDDPDPAGPVVQQTVLAALASREPLVSDFFSHADGIVHLDIAAAVRDASGRPLAVMILRANAADFLYPMIQAWPTRSSSAETLLVQRRGDELIYLNELRHHSKTALSLRESLSLTNLPTVQAVRGKQGMFLGQDYRGKEVLADLRPVPGLPWFMVVKADTSEVFAEGQFRARSIAIIMFLAILLAFAATSFAYRQQVGFYRSMNRVEREQWEAMNEFRTILYSIGDAVITTDRKGLVRQMNQVAELYTGWKEAEAHGRSLEEVFRIVNEETHATVENPVQRVLREGVVVGLANHTLLIARDGTSLPIADSAAPIRDKSGADINGVVLVFRDQTAERDAQKAVQASADQLSFAMEVIHTGAWELDLRDHKARRTLLHDRIFGYESLLPEWTYEMFLEHVLAEDRSEVDRRFREATAAQADWSFECRICRADGEIRWIWAAGGHERNAEGKPVRMSGIVQDITERKRTEAELLKMQKLESIGTLAGGIAHDFNNILMGLFGNISLAKNELPHDHPAFKSLEDSEKSMNRAVRLTNQLLTFARGGEPVKEDVSLGLLVEEVVPFDLSGSNVRLVFKQADDLWMANADKGQVQQVMSNLALNARQAMPNGGHLYIALENAKIQETDLVGLRPGNYVKVTVRDEGVGIAPKNLGRIFDPYFSTKETGRGLGLATSYSIVSKHGGHISVVSEPGKGATFTFYLPASESRPLPPGNRSVPAAPMMKPSSKILIMDDEEYIRTVLPFWLKPMGCLVETASDGQQAIDLYKQSLKAGTPFDVMILDLTIPGGLGGQEVLKQILAMNPGAKAIVSSGYAEDSVVSNYSQYGFKGGIAKPYTETQLRAVLTQVLVSPQTA